MRVVQWLEQNAAKAFPMHELYKITLLWLNFRYANYATFLGLIGVILLFALSSFHPLPVPKFST